MMEGPRLYGDMSETWSHRNHLICVGHFVDQEELKVYEVDGHLLPLQAVSDSQWASQAGLTGTLLSVDSFACAALS